MMHGNTTLTPEMIKMLIDHTPVAYIILDENYRIHYINDHFLKLRKLKLEDTIGQVCYNISNGGVHCRQCAVAEALKTGKKAFVSRKDILPDGSVRFIDDYAIPLANKTTGGKRYVLEIMVDRTQEMLARERRDAAYDEILSILSSLLDAKDPYTATHSESVRKISHRLATALALLPAEIFDISVAASLHDIGKIKIPNAIINKPGKLTDEEFALVKKHPAISAEMIESLSGFQKVKHIVRHHHERIDSRGYPDGLSGDEISLGAKIVAVADTYDAMTSTRSYRKALSHSYALNEIQRVAGTQLDKGVVDAFLAMDFSAILDGAEAQRQLDKPVERTLHPSQAMATPGCNKACSQCSQCNKCSYAQNAKVFDFDKNIDEQSLLDEVFKNSPCGYVLMDSQRNVLFASSYFLEYMGLAEEDVTGWPCFKVGGIGVPCKNCAIEKALQSGRMEYMRREQDTRNGRKIFDLFGMPLSTENNNDYYVIEVIIDRTDEILLEREREQDFEQLIQMLEGLLKSQADANEKSTQLPETILLLRSRLEQLMAQQKELYQASLGNTEQ